MFRLLRHVRTHSAHIGPPLSFLVLEFAAIYVVAVVFVIIGTAVGLGAGNRPLSCVVTNVVCSFVCLLLASVT